MRNLLKPGGVLVCEDFNASSIRTEPPTQPYRRLIEISRALDAQQCLESEIGSQGPAFVSNAQHQSQCNLFCFRLAS